MTGHHLHDLAAIVAALEAGGRLAHVRSEVDPRHELAGIAVRLEGGPQAVLFEKVKGQRWPILAGLYWNRGLIAELIGTDERALPQFVADCIAKAQRAPVDPVVVTGGPVLEVTEPDVDLGKIPVPVHALKDTAAACGFRGRQAARRSASARGALVSRASTVPTTRKSTAKTPSTNTH